MLLHSRFESNAISRTGGAQKSKRERKVCYDFSISTLLDGGGDQIASLCFQFGSFTTMKLCPIAHIILPK